MRIVIAGVTAANRLARKHADAQITVVNPRDEFVERIRLHELVAGTGAAVRPLRDMLHERIDLCLGEIVEIAADAVILSDGRTIAFDRLVYAVGSRDDAPEGTFALGGVDDARAAHERLAALPAGARVTVVGGGLTGLETAAEVASSRPDLAVRIVSTEFGASLSDGARRRIREVLAGFGVEVVTGRWTPDQTADLTLWALAAGVNDLAARSGLTTDDAGRVAVDECLRSVSHPRIYAVGDAAAVPGARLSCQAAIPQAAAAADNLVRESTGVPGAAFSMSFIGQNVSLGRRDAVIQTSYRDDTPRKFYFGGRKAALVKEQVCRGVIRWARSGTALTIPGPK